MSEYYHEIEKYLFYDKIIILSHIIKQTIGQKINAFFWKKKRVRSLRTTSNEKTASLAVIWGRRRIGKSTLIAEFLKGKKSWSFSGLPPQEHKTQQDEINYFVREMARNIGMP